jgi:hypothetical protein
MQCVKKSDNLKPFRLPKTYTFSHKAAGLMQEVPDFTSQVVNEMLPFCATAGFSTPPVTVLAGQKVETSVLVTPPQDIFPEYRPIYTVYIMQPTTTKPTASPT